MILQRVATMKEARLGWLDYLLSLVASVLAVLSAGFGLGVNEIAYQFAGIVLVGTLVSFVVQMFVPAKFARMDGVFYAITAIIVLFGARQFNAMLPDEGFPRQLIVSGILCWMISLGSFFLWRDVSIIFQAVPTIALFGLVGAWDTFGNTTYYFFGFLLCFATLFARMHSRQMYMQATQSGFTNMSEIRTGPWKWMAGPEWALASAAAIIALSILGAPVLQFSVQGVAGFVNIPVPQQRRATPIASTFASGGAGTVLIGGGNPTLTKVPLMHVTMPTLHYLKTSTYKSYNDARWTVVPKFANVQDFAAAMMPQSNDPVKIFRDEIKEPGLVPFEVIFLFRFEDSLPIPGEISSVDSIGNFNPRQDGTLELADTGIQNASGQAIIDVASAEPTEANKNLPSEYFNGGGTDSITPRVRQLAEEAVKDAKTDYEKARAIQDAIVARCTYNIDAAGAPSGIDPVEYFLFESKEGYCDAFASAMVLMARAVDLPARYVIGYYPNGERDAAGRYTILDADRHAWGEVFFKDHGWVIFDPTTDAPEVPGKGRGASNSDTALTDKLWFKIAMGVVAVLGLGLIAFSIRQFYRVRERFIAPSQKELGKLYKGFVRLLEHRTGKPRRPSQTPEEYVAVVAPLLDGTLGDVEKVNNTFVELFYRKDAVSPERITSVRESLRALKALFKANKVAKKRAT